VTIVGGTLAFASPQPKFLGGTRPPRPPYNRRPWLTQGLLFITTKFRAPGWRGSPRTRASKRGTPLKRCYFAIIGSSSVKTVADWYRHVAHHNKHWSRAF